MSLLLLFNQPAGGPANYAVTADAGSYTYSGVAATIAKSRIVVGAAGSYAYSGVNATLARSRALIGSSGAYNYAGVAATVLRGKKVVANAGAYSYAGTPATITYTPVSGGAYTITANAGSYVVSGQTATLAKTTANTAVYWGGAPSRKRNKEYEQPTPEQVEAERIRLGIIEAKKQVIVIANKVKDKPPEKQVEPRQQLNEVRREIARLESEYAIKKAQLAARGELIRSEAIYRAAMQEMEKRRAEESDIAFLMAFLAEC